MIQFEMPTQQRYQLVAYEESDMPEWAEDFTICTLMREDCEEPFMFYGGKWNTLLYSRMDKATGTLYVNQSVKEGDQPWDAYADEVTSLVVGNQCHEVASGAFDNLTKLKYVSIKGDVTVEDGAFGVDFIDPFGNPVQTLAGYEYVGFGDGELYQHDPSIYSYTSANMVNGLATGSEGALYLVLPATHSGAAVTGFYNLAFSEKGIVKVLALPVSYSFSGFGLRTFQTCTSLTTVMIPEGVTTLGASDFGGCTSLTTVMVSDSLTEMGNTVFDGCTSLASIDLSRITTVGGSTFRNTALTDIDLSSITTVGGSAFSGITTVASVVIGENLVSVEANSFGSWTFYAADGTTQVDKTVASNLAGKTFQGRASKLVEVAGPEPGHGGDYLYAITTDADNQAIQYVERSVEGGALRTVSLARTEATRGADKISSVWQFGEDGVGPFNCWYGVFGIDDGRLLARLDPDDLSFAMDGSEAPAGNVFLVVPTVYWKVSGNTLYLSSKASYTAGGQTVSGMTAYAHTATSGGTESVYPYLGIGVYEAYSEDGVLLSVPGKPPKVNLTCDQFKALADAMAPATGSDYQQWNLFQYTLFKMMAYTVMGTKNSQWMMGDGPVDNEGASVTGQSSAAGPYATSTSQYDRVFIENAWGSIWNFVGDVSVNDYQLYAGNALGGATLGSGGNQAEMTGIVLPSDSNWVATAYLDEGAWGMTKTVGSDNHANPAYVGDFYWQNTGWRCCVVGGGRSHGSRAGLSCVAVNNTLYYRYTNIGARLAYVMTDSAMSPAPAASVQAKSLASPDREALAEMVRLAQEEALTMEPEPMPEPEPVEEPEEPVEELEEQAEEPIAEESDEGTIDIEGL